MFYTLKNCERVLEITYVNRVRSKKGKRSNY